MRAAPLANGRVFIAQVRTPRQQPLARGVLHPEAGRRDDELLPSSDRLVRDREEGDGAERHALQPRLGVERGVEERVPRLMCDEPCHGSPRKVHSRGSALPLLLAPSQVAPRCLAPGQAGAALRLTARQKRAEQIQPVSDGRRAPLVAPLLQPARFDTGA